MANPIGFTPRRLGLTVIAGAVLALTVPAVVGALQSAPQGAANDQIGPARGLAGMIDSPTAGPDAPRFDVASIKPNKGGAGSPSFSRLLPTGEVRTTNTSLKRLIVIAYDLQMTDIVTGGPDWMASQGFDVDAKPEGRSTGTRGRLMLRTLLAERFNLVVRREPRDMPLYALTLARSDGRLGPQMRRPAGKCIQTIPDFAQASGVSPPTSVKLGTQPPLGQPGRRCGMSPDGPGVIKAGSTTIKGIVMLLAPALDRPVVDQTGLTGEFDFDLQYAGLGPAFGLNGRGAPFAPADTAPDPTDATSIFTAIREQLGLKL